MSDGRGTPCATASSRPAGEPRRKTPTGGFVYAPPRGPVNGGSRDTPTGGPLETVSAASREGQGVECAIIVGIARATPTGYPPAGAADSAPIAVPRQSAPTAVALLSRSREGLSMFISTSVLPQTSKGYEKGWKMWSEFVKNETGEENPFLTGMIEDHKAALVSLMMMGLHQDGKRGKGATVFTAAVRHWFARTLCSTAFLDSAIITTARTSCLMKPDELRAKKDQGISDSVKLPMCEAILTDMSARLWIEGDWSDGAKKSKAAYVASMYGFEFASRVGEYTHSEPNQVDHCVRVSEFIFAVQKDGRVDNVPGCELVSLKLGYTGEPASNLGVQGKDRHLQEQDRREGQVDRPPVSGRSGVLRRLGFVADRQRDYRSR